MQNVNKELQKFFTEEDVGFTDDILNFLEENKDWDKKKIKAATLLNEIANRMNKVSIYSELIQNNLRIYEEAVTKTLPTHRDHFVHTAYVYLLGLYISKRDPKYNECLKEAFEYNYPVKGGEHNWEQVFKLRWAITALFHDAGYPIEIAAKQMNKYLMDMNWNKRDDKNPMRFEMRHFRDTYSFEYLITPDPLFPSGENIPRRTAQYIMSDNVFDMIAYNLSFKYVDFSYKTIRNMIIDCFQDKMKYGYIDHGIVGAIALANLAHDLYSKKNWNPEDFYCHFGDCLGAIVLHTRKSWMPSIFWKRISMLKHPIAWLLVLCDEIQEWLRPTGKELESDVNIMRILDDFQIGFSDGTIEMHCRDYEDTKNLIDKLQWNLEPFNTKILIQEV